MTILPAPPATWNRPRMTLGVMLASALRKLGLDNGVEWDHRPPLYARKFDTDTNDTIPAANDARYIEPIAPKEHDIRTNGPGGDKRITTAGSDANNRAKTKRLTSDQEEFRRKVLHRECGQKRKPTGNWPAGQKLRSRGFERRRT